MKRAFISRISALALLAAVIVPLNGSFAQAAVPAAPQVELVSATCHAPENLVKIAGVDAASVNNMRVVITVGENDPIFIPKAYTALALAEGTKTFEDYLATFGKQASQYYGQNLKVALYYFDKNRTEDPSLYDPDMQARNKVRFIKLAEQTVTPVDPTSVCETIKPATPTVVAEVVDDFTQITVSGWDNNWTANYRFVVTVDGVSKAVPAAVTAEILEAGGQFILEELLPNAADYYGKEATVDVYFFDKEKRYAQDAYVDPASVGTAQPKVRFIRLASTTVTLTDPTQGETETEPAVPETEPAVPETEPVAPSTEPVTPEIKPILALDKEATIATDKVVISGSGFGAEETLRLELHSTPVFLAEVVTTTTGTFSVEVAIPAGTTPGKHDVVVVRKATGESLVALSLEVLASSAVPAPAQTVPSTPAKSGAVPQLAKTGADNLSLFLVGLGLVGLGGMVLRPRTRRS